MTRRPEGHAPSVVMIGTAPEGKGGVAAVVNVYVEYGLLERYGVRYVVTHREGSRLQKLWCSVTGGLTLLWLLLTRRVAMLHAHVASDASFRRKATYLAMARAFGVRTVFHLHGGAFRQFTDEVASPRLRRFIVKTVQRSTVAVALSDSWAAYLRSLAPQTEVRVVANPVFLPPVAEHGQEEEGRLLYLGRASKAKGVFDLLDAFARISATRPTARLAIGGDGDLEAVRRRAQDLGLSERVEVLGWVSGDAKNAQMARAQVFVLPSYNEGLPMAMLEAMAQGKVVVVTPVGGIPEAVQHDQQGLIVQPGAVDQLAQTLATVLGDATQRRRLGDAARQRVAERFSTAHVLGSLSALYEDFGIQPVGAGREQR